MDLWTTRLYNPVVFRFYVNFPGCVYNGYIQWLDGVLTYLESTRNSYLGFNGALAS